MSRDLVSEFDMRPLAPVIAALCASLAAPALAADPAVKAPAAVDHVRVCSTYGEGYLYVPGTDTCVRIGGDVRFELRGGIGVDESFGGGSAIGSFGSGRSQNAIDTRARVSLVIDARSQTDYGLLRSFADVRFNVTTGGSSVQSEIDQAFVQWAGLTAGRTQSFFDFYTGYALAATYGNQEPDAKTNLIAYTYGWGNGVTSTLSLEDPTTNYRLVGDYETTENYGGLKAPDVVANVAVTQVWGGAQLMAALHRVYTDGSNGYDIDRLGYALGAGVVIKLPMLGSNDKLALQAVYSKGSVRYAAGSVYRSYTHGAIGADYNGDDLTDAFSLAAGFQHAFLPNLVWALQGAYVRIDNGAINTLGEYDLATSLTWTPVRNLELAVGLDYRNVELAAQTASLHGLSSSGDDAWALGLRMTRSF